MAFSHQRGRGGGRLKIVLGELQVAKLQPDNMRVWKSDALDWGNTAKSKETEDAKNYL